MEIPGFQTEAQREQLVSVVQIGEVSAEYSTGQRPTGEWFALATLDASTVSGLGPARLTVATADSQDELLQVLTQRIERDTV